MSRDRMKSPFAKLSGILACFLMIFLVSCSRQSPRVETVTIDNVAPRRDVTGQIIDAHGGCVQFFNGRFYLYGTAFGTNKEYSGINSLAVYSSPDLKDWKLEGGLLKNPPTGVYYRPYVVFNPKTKKYVLWYNWYPKLWTGQDGVAISDTPAGPFTIVTGKANLQGTCPGDGSLFVDNDGTGYYIYTDIANDYSVRIERLTPDFLDSCHEMSKVMSTGAEAPVMFRRNNIYYVLCGPLCATCPRGSEVQVFTSLSPLGPFSTKPAFNINRFFPGASSSSPAGGVTPTNEIGRDASTQAPPKGWFAFGRESSAPIIPAQETWIAQIPLGGDVAYIWMGDRWGSAPDGLIAHDFQFWSAPLEFTADGEILPIKNVSQWYISWALNN
jgi:Glycosyl hydrolases family 43